MTHYRCGRRRDHGIFVTIIVIDVAFPADDQRLRLWRRTPPAWTASATANANVTATALWSSSTRARCWLGCSRCRRGYARGLVIVCN